MVLLLLIHVISILTDSAGKKTHCIIYHDQVMVTRGTISIIYLVL